MRIEITDSKTKPLLARYVYRNPASAQGWPDDLINMTDKITESNANNLRTGDFKTDLFKHHSTWNSITSLFGSLGQRDCSLYTPPRWPSG